MIDNEKFSITFSTKLIRSISIEMNAYIGEVVCWRKEFNLIGWPNFNLRGINIDRCRFQVR